VAAHIFSGFLGDNLFWCGQKEEPGINYEECPEYDSCEGHANTLFWQTTSREFARNVEGHLRVLMNGSASPAYDKTTVFGSYELPNLNPSKVTKISVYVVHEIGMPELEKCGEGSLLQLEREIRAYGHNNFECVNDPGEIMMLLCVDKWSAPECELAAFDNGANNQHLSLLYNFVIFTMTLSHWALK